MGRTGQDNTDHCDIACQTRIGCGLESLRILASKRTTASSHKSVWTTISSTLILSIEGTDGPTMGLSIFTVSLQPTLWLVADISD